MVECYSNRKGKIHYRDGSTEDMTIKYSYQGTNDLIFCTKEVMYEYIEWLEFPSIKYICVATRRHQFYKLSYDSEGILISTICSDIDHITIEED